MSMTDVEILDRMNKRLPPTGNLLGCHIDSIDQEKGIVRARYLAKPEFCNPMGSVQGGIVAAMLDDVAAFAGIAKLQAPAGIPTLEFKVSFFAAAKPGVLLAEGRVVKMGRTVAFLASDLFDESGKLLASMTATAIIQPRPPKQ
jgi:uncharacterized protein (TIGR00369 family)